MSRLVDYLVVVSYGTSLEALDPAELSDSLGSSAGGAEQLTDAVAAVGGAGGPVEVEPSVTTQHGGRHRDDSPSSFRPTMLSPIAASPAAGGSSGGSGCPGDTPMSPGLPLSPVGEGTAASRAAAMAVMVPSPLSPNSGSAASASSSIDLSSPMPRSPALQSLHVKADATSDRTGAESPPAAAPSIAAQFALPGSPNPDASPLSLAVGTASPTPAPATVLASNGDASLSVMISPMPSEEQVLSPHQYPRMAHPNLNVSIMSPQPQPTPQALPQPVPASAAPASSPASGSVPLTPRTLQSFTERSYRSHIVDRFPPRDHRSVPFPPGVGLFALPEDVTLSIAPGMPSFYYFASTGANGVRLYGACLKFWEPLPPQLAERVWAEEKIVQENKQRIAAAIAALSSASGGAAGGAGGGSNNGATSAATDSDASASASLRSHSYSGSNSSAASSSSSASGSGSGSGAAASPASASGGDSSATSSAALYGYCLAPASRRPAIYVSKAVCLLSTYAFLRQFRQFLTGAYRQSLTPSSLPLERLVCNFMGEVPVPPLGEIKVQWSSGATGGGSSSGGEDVITFARPPPNNPFGFHHFPLRLLFETLDFAHVLLLFECMLAERRVLLLSRRVSLLTIVAESLLALMFPFIWPHVYIPLLPKALIDFLHAPMPYLIGMNSSYLSPHTLKGDILEELVIVDLDANSIAMPGATTRKPPPLPQKEKKKLWKKLKALDLYDRSGAVVARNEYQQKQLDTLDLAFSNAPLPGEVETAELTRTNLAHLVAAEVAKNTNMAAPSSAANSAAGRKAVAAAGGDAGGGGGGGMMNFSSGLHQHIVGSAYGGGARGGAGSSGGGGSGGTNGTRIHRSGSHSGAVSITSPSALSQGLSHRRGSFSPSSSSSPSHSGSGGGGGSAPSSTLQDAQGCVVDYLVSSAFFRVFVSLLKDYRPFLIFPTAASPVPDPCFDLQGFLQTHPGGGKGGVSEFFEEFVKTQSWRRFCEERTFPSSGSPSSSSSSTAAMRTEGKRVLFFDESVLAKRNRSKFLSRRFETPFLRDRSTDLSKTFVAPSPDTSNLPGPPGRRYVYPLWPRLDPHLFAKPRIITPLLIKQQQAHVGGNMLLKSGLSFGNWLVRKPGQGQGSGNSGGGGGGFGGGVLSALSGFGSGAKSSSSRRASLETGHPSGGGGGGGGETTVATLWFLLFAGITGETGPAAAGQLDTAFQVLVNLRNNGLPIEEEIFPCMVFACGSCGRPDRAVDVLREMQNCGLQPSPGTFAALLQIVTMNDLKGHEALANLRAGVAGGGAGRPAGGSPLTAGSIVNSVKERLNMATRPSSSAANNISSGSSTVVGGAQQSSPSPPAPAPWYAAPASQGQSGSSQLDPTNPLSPLSSPQPLKIQEIAEEERITMFQLQFEMIFAGLEIDTTESCPECDKVVLDHHIRAGWTASPNDYTTACPFCGDRFVARFSVRSKAWVNAERSRAAAAATGQQSRAATPLVPSSASPPSQGSARARAESAAVHGASCAGLRPSNDDELLSPDSLAMLRATRTLLASSSDAHETMGSASSPSLESQPRGSRESSRGSTAFHPHLVSLPGGGGGATAPSSSSSTSTAGAATASPPATPPLSLEYLSPSVLKKEVLHLLSQGKPARYLCRGSFRKASPVLFWNLAWHFTNQCLPVDFLIRRVQRSRPNTAAGAGAGGAIGAEASAGAGARRKAKAGHRKRGSTGSQSSDWMGSVHADESDTCSVSRSARASGASQAHSRSHSVPAASSLRAPVDDFERAIAAARASGVGRSFGYGTGGMVSGAGAVGISLGQILRTRDATIKPLGGGAVQQAQEEEEEESELSADSDAEEGDELSGAEVEEQEEDEEEQQREEKEQPRHQQPAEDDASPSQPLRHSSPAGFSSPAPSSSPLAHTSFSPSPSPSPSPSSSPSPAAIAAPSGAGSISSTSPIPPSVSPVSPVAVSADSTAAAAASAAQMPASSRPLAHEQSSPAAAEAAASANDTPSA